MDLLILLLALAGIPLVSLLCAFVYLSREVD